MTNRLRDPQKSDHKPRAPAGKRTCPRCGRRVTLRKGAYPSHAHPHLPGKLCTGSYKPHRPKLPRASAIRWQQSLPFQEGNK